MNKSKQRGSVDGTGVLLIVAAVVFLIFFISAHYFNPIKKVDNNNVQKAISLCTGSGKEVQNITLYKDTAFGNHDSTRVTCTDGKLQYEYEVMVAK